MTIKLESPHPFAERFLLFGGGGVGKSNTVLNIIEHAAVGEMHVVECDYSASYMRALATDFTEVQDRVHVAAVDPEWQSFIDAVNTAVETGDPEVDWLAIDPVNGSYDWVQDWVLEKVHGGDLPRMLMELKKNNPDSRDYARARADLMNWELVKKEYNKLWRAIQRWKGHLVLCAEAKAVRNDEKDDETRMLYGPLGFMPAGQATLRHVASSTLFLDHPKRGEWRITTVKDRNREELDREPVDDFSIDYLQQIAGWTMVRSGKNA